MDESQLPGTHKDLSLPKSPTGRVPKWVIEERLGRSRDEPPAWRSTEPAGAPRPRKMRRRRRRRTMARRSGPITTAISLLVVGLVIWSYVGGALRTVPAFANFPGIPGVQRGNSNAPTPGHESQSKPLGVPAPIAQTSDAYRFMGGKDSPMVAYDPCRPIHYVTRLQGQPWGGGQMVASAIARVSAATGLVFVNDGSTDEAPSRQRKSYQPDRYGDRWAPVLISWDSSSENTDFAGTIIGEAGSTAMSLAGHPSVYVTGQVELDAGKLTQHLTTPAGLPLAQAVIEHELGHLVGLGHDDDPAQLMYPEARPTHTDFGAGDLTGLALLGRGACVPQL